MRETEVECRGHFLQESVEGIEKQVFELNREEVTYRVQRDHEVAREVVDFFSRRGGKVHQGGGASLRSRPLPGSVSQEEFVAAHGSFAKDQLLFRGRVKLWVADAPAERLLAVFTVMCLRELLRGTQRVVLLLHVRVKISFVRDLKIGRGGHRF